MADERHVFTIVEDNTTGAGIKLPGRAEGDTAGSNHMPSMVAKDSAGNYKLIELRDQGDAASGVDALPAMPVKDLSGNLQYINARDEGDAASGVDALPGLIAKDNSGNLDYLNINADGELLISADPAGTKVFGDAVVTAVALGSADDVVTLTLTASAVYEKLMCSTSQSFPTRWELVQVDDVGVTDVETQHASWLTGPGQFTYTFDPQWLEFTAGGTGVINLVLRGTQLTGSKSDHHGYVEAFQKA